MFGEAPLSIDTHISSRAACRGDFGLDIINNKYHSVLLLLSFNFSN